MIRRPRKGFWVFFPLALFAWFAPATAQADTYTVTGPQDWNFELQSEVLFTARTYAWQYGIDSMLWLYDSNNNIIAANDDYYGLDSNISLVLQAGSYRLRTSVCCGNPDAWYGTSYQLEVNASAVQTTTTSSTTTTTAPSTTTTTQAPIEPQESTTTTSTTVPETTTTVYPATTTESTSPTTSTTSSTTTTTSPPPPPPILEPLLPPETTVETTTTTSTVPPSTTTTSVAETTTTPVATTTSVPPTTELPTTTVVTETSVPESTQEEGQETTPDSGSVFIPLAPLADASEEEKEEFESQVDIFSGDFDDYVPSGSNITVAQRRVIVGATVILFVVPLPVPAPVTPSTTSSASESTGRKEQD